jgi:hypothetical protein
VLEVLLYRCSVLKLETVGAADCELKIGDALLLNRGSRLSTKFADCTGTDWDYKGKTFWP